MRENLEVPDVEDDTLTTNEHYGESGSMLEELIIRLPHAGPIFCNNNKSIFMMIYKAITGTSVESTIKSYSICKDGQGWNSSRLIQTTRMILNI